MEKNLIVVSRSDDILGSAMERIQSINPQRIEWCCADHGITPEELSIELGISSESMDAVLRGEGGLTFNQLRRIAVFFGRGVLFFLEPGPVDDATVHTAQFRTLANQKPEISSEMKKLIERVERQRDVYLGLREDLDEDEQIRFSPPVLSSRAPREAARIVREWLGLLGKNSFDTYRDAVEAKGVLVFRSNGYNGKWQISKESPILGFTIFDPTCPVIVIKKQFSEAMQSFTLMHELGHLLLDQSSSIDEEAEIHSEQGHEQKANAFAGNLLVPDEFLFEIRDSDLPVEVSEFDEWLLPQRRVWGVSTEVILRRLLESGRLSQQQYSAYRKWRKETAPREEAKGSRQYRYREPGHIFGERFVTTVLGALYDQKITLARASSYLDGLKIKDLHRLGRHYAPV